MPSDPWANLPNLSGVTSPDLNKQHSDDAETFYASSGSGTIDPVAGRVLNVPRASVYLAGAFSTTTGVAQFPTWDTVVFDTDGMWNSTNPTRLTVRTRGIYMIVGNVSWVLDTRSYREAVIYIDHGLSLGHSVVHPSQVSFTMQNTVAMVGLDAGQYVELYISQNTTANLALVAGRDATSLSMCLISTIGTDAS